MRMMYADLALPGTIRPMPGEPGGRTCQHSLLHRPPPAISGQPAEKQYHTAARHADSVHICCAGALVGCGGMVSLSIFISAFYGSCCREVWILQAVGAFISGIQEACRIMSLHRWMQHTESVSQTQRMQVRMCSEPAGPVLQAWRSDEAPACPAFTGGFANTLVFALSCALLHRTPEHTTAAASRHCVSTGCHLGSHRMGAQYA